MPLREFIEIHAAGSSPKPAFSKAKEPKGKFHILIKMAKLTRKSSKNDAKMDFQTALKASKGLKMIPFT